MLVFLFKVVLKKNGIFPFKKETNIYFVANKKMNMRKFVMLIILVSFFTSLDAQRKYKKKLKSPEQVEIESEDKEEKALPVFRKITLYADFCRMKISEASITKWSSLNYDFISSGEYYTLQKLQEKKSTFQPILYLRGGVLRNNQLNSKFTLSYGLGVDAFSFKLLKESINLDERIIDHYKVIQEGTNPIYEVTHINPIIENNNNNLFIINNGNGNAEHRVVALSLPLRLSYNVYKDLNIQAQTCLLLPIISRTVVETSKFTSNGLETVFKTNNNEHKISRILTQVGVGLHYKLVEQTSLHIDYRYNINSLMVVDIEKSNNFLTSNDYEANKVKNYMIDFGISLSF